MAVDFGSCWSCTDDLVMPSTMASGNRVVAEAIVRRWGTPRGRLVDDPNYGLDLTSEVSNDLGPGDIARLSQAAAAEAQKDERVLSAKVTIVLTAAGILTIVGVITTANGPFQLVAAVSAITVSLLQVST